MPNLIIPTTVTTLPIANGTPTFQDSFSTGTLNATMWGISNYATSGVGSFVNTGVTMTGNTLNLVMTNGGASANGGQITSQANTYFHGTYEWTFKAAADANGAAHSGCVTSPFLYDGTATQSELDIVEIQGQFPNAVSSGAWANATFDTESITPFLPLHLGYHTYTVMFNASGIYWFFDGLLYQVQTTHLPTHAMSILMCLYPTNSAGWGGVTSSIAETVHVSNFSYWSAV